MYHPPFASSIWLRSRSVKSQLPYVPTCVCPIYLNYRFIYRYKILIRKGSTAPATTRGRRVVEMKTLAHSIFFPVYFSTNYQKTRPTTYHKWQAHIDWMITLGHSIRSFQSIFKTIATSSLCTEQYVFFTSQ